MWKRERGGYGSIMSKIALTTFRAKKSKLSKAAFFHIFALFLKEKKIGTWVGRGRWAGFKLLL